MHFLRRSRNYKEALKAKQHLDSLNEKDDDASSSTNYESEDSTKVHIGDEIVLSDVTGKMFSQFQKKNINKAIIH